MSGLNSLHLMASLLLCNLLPSVDMLIALNKLKIILEANIMNYITSNRSDLSCLGFVKLLGSVLSNYGNFHQI